MVNKSSLRISALRLFIRNDRLSKSQAMKLLGRNDHGNISDACDRLEREQLIRFCSKQSHGGRPERFFEITEEGVNYLIQMSTTPLEFWVSLMFVVYYQKELFSWKKILELFEAYLQRYLKHYLYQGYYSFQLDSFNIACKLWFENAIVKSRKASAAQKVLEVLAVSPGISVPEIAQASSENTGTVESIIKMYTTIPHKPVSVDMNGHQDSPFYNISEWRFQIHRAIVHSKSPTGTVKFSLSLFGILMVLYLIMKSNTDSLPPGLMQSYEEREYIDVIAKNYRHKIPLIFGKWPRLKSLLEGYAFLNFGLILDKSTREFSFKEPLSEGGNKELYIGMKEIMYGSQRQLLELQNAGMNVLFNFSPDEGYTIKPKITNDGEDVQNSTKLVFYLYLYLISIIRPTDFDSETFDSMFSNQNYLGPQLSKEISTVYDVSHLERSLAFEISLIYYLHLKTRQVFSYDKSMPVYFYQVLDKILQADKDISAFFNENLGNIKKYYGGIYHTVETMLEECSVNLSNDN